MYPLLLIVAILNSTMTVVMGGNLQFDFTPKICIFEQDKGETEQNKLLEIFLE